MSQSSTIPLTTVLIAALIAAATDIANYRVHNLLTLPLIAAGLTYHTAVGGIPGLADSLSGLLFGSGALMIFYLAGGMGAGDVKLMAAIGAWLGIPATSHVFFVGSVAAGVYAAILVLVTGRARKTWLDVQGAWYRLRTIGKHLCADAKLATTVNGEERRQRVVPFAAMVALGVLATCVWSWGGAASLQSQHHFPHPGLDGKSRHGSIGEQSHSIPQFRPVSGGDE